MRSIFNMIFNDKPPNECEGVLYYDAGRKELC